MAIKYVPYEFTATDIQLLRAIGKNPEGIEDIELAANLGLRVPELQKVLKRLASENKITSYNKGINVFWKKINGKK